jgi:hypothetical protein
MNVRIRYNTDFRTGTWFADQFIVNNFSVNLQLITQSSDPADHSICMGRIRTVFDALEHSMLINEHHTDKIKDLINCGFCVTAFPQEPIDQIVGIVLFEKLNAVLEGRMRVTDLDICSDLGDNIWFMHSEHEKISAIPDSGWWTESTPDCNVSEPTATEKKVVKLRKQSSWANFDLGWCSAQPSETVIINIKDDK